MTKLTVTTEKGETKIYTKISAADIIKQVGHGLPTAEKSTTEDGGTLFTLPGMSYLVEDLGENVDTGSNI